MRVQRIIHPIGQGAFYSERFFDDNDKVIANVIYDCGTMSKNSNLEHDIKDYFSDQEIDILFLSHLHSDHINGVKKLKQYCGKIKNVILPFYGDDKYIMLFYHKYIESTTADVISLINSPESFFDKDTRIFYVSSDWNENTRWINNSDDIIILENPETHVIENLDPTKHIKLGFPVIPRNLLQYWIYVPINLHYNKYTVQLKRMLPTFKTTRDLKTFIDEDQGLTTDELKEIKKKYKDLGIPLELNSNSLLVYSGPCGRNTKNHTAPKCQKGCLYTGDSCFVHKDIPLLMNIINGLNEHIGMIQIPHHGSKENFSQEIFNINHECKYYFLSHGIKNKYGHPSINVVSAFPYHNLHFKHHFCPIYPACSGYPICTICHTKRRHLFCVNENPQSAFVIDINI